MSQYVILAPHLDDAVINCWHTLCEEDAVVMTICAGIPPAGTYRFWDIICGIADGSKMMRARRSENEDAVVLSGSARPQVYLDYLDAQYRKNPLNIEELAARIATQTPTGSILLAPLAASTLRKHSDHVAVRRAALALLQNGYDVRFYPDAPYMHLPRLPRHAALKKLEERAEQALGRSVRVHINELKPAQQASKSAALRAYKTQYNRTNLFSFGGLSRLTKRGYEVVLQPLAAS